MRNLCEPFAEAVQRHGDRVAVEFSGGGSISYSELDSLSNRVRDLLVNLGVQRGDRVGFLLHKSIDSVATLLGILKCGAAYVPVDPDAPLSRNAFIFSDCTVKAIFVETPALENLQRELKSLQASPLLVAVSDPGNGQGLASALEETAAPITDLPFAPVEGDELAYILYTSGSTGRPKGVMISHENARCFVDWCGEVFEPQPSDRFSSHAPFHFDLSILDLYTPLHNGSTLVLISEDLGKDPKSLARFISERRLTIWYSTPSILNLLTEYGGLEQWDCSALRIVIFAGEVFPMKQLRRLMGLWPSPRYFNLYGPTETNVCTYYEVPNPIPLEASDALPIGKACPHYEALVLDAEGREVARGEEGELYIHGSGVMRGYWGRSDLTEQVFRVLEGGRPWYGTGDLVVEENSGDYRFLGRKDRMVKKRGYRVELGEIESCLNRHLNVREAAVVALKDPEEGVRIRAHLSTKDGERISLIQLKSFCAQHVPLYMVPDLFHFHEELPKTSTGKTDYQTLTKLP
jgi:amino acid adenylation domain-containing protein